MPNLTMFESARGKLLTNLTTALENRFSDLDSGVMQASLIVDFRMWPDKENSKGQYIKLIQL